MMCKIFSITFLCLFCLIGVSALSINRFMDPYNFVLSNNTNFIGAANERIIKSAFLNKNKKTYDSVLIGSSRSSYIDVSKSKTNKMFNYSVSGISIDEYLPYLRHYQATQSNPKIIILSLDFHGTNQNFDNSVNQADVFSKSNSKFKQYVEYIKVKTAHQSLNMLKPNRKEFGDFYTRDMIKKRKDQETGLTDAIISGTLDYYKVYCLSDYSYRNDYKHKLSEIRDAFPDAKIIVLICPVHESLMSLTLELAGQEAYNQWLEQIDQVFGAHYEFNQSEIVNNRSNFFDSAHIYPYVGDQIFSSLLAKNEQHYVSNN